MIENPNSLEDKAADSRGETRSAYRRPPGFEEGVFSSPEIFPIPNEALLPPLQDRHPVDLRNGRIGQESTRRWLDFRRLSPHHSLLQTRRRW